MEELLNNNKQTMEKLSATNEPEVIAKIISSSKLKDKLKVYELDQYDNIEITSKFKIEGKIHKKQEDLLKSLKRDVEDQLCGLYGKEKGRSLAGKIWDVEYVVMDIGGKFDEISLTNTKGYKENIRPFEDEICFIEFLDLSLGKYKDQTEIVLAKHNSYQRFKNIKNLKDKKIINYIGIANVEKTNLWLEILKKYNIYHDGENMFQYNRNGAAEELGISESSLPYACIVDTKGRIQYAGNPAEIDIEHFLLTLWETGTGEIKQAEIVEKTSESNCPCPNCSKKKLNEKEYFKEDPNPSWTALDDEIKLEIIRDANQRLETFGLRCKFLVYRQVIYEAKKTIYHTKMFFKGYLNTSEEELVQTIIWDLKDLWKFDEILIQKMTQSDDDEMGMEKKLAIMQMLAKMGLMSK